MCAHLTYTHVYIHIHVGTHANVDMKYIHAHMHTRTYAYTHIHIHIHACPDAHVDTNYIPDLKGALCALILHTRYIFKVDILYIQHIALSLISHTPYMTFLISHLSSDTHSHLTYTIQISCRYGIHMTAYH